MAWIADLIVKHRPPRWPAAAVLMVLVPLMLSIGACATASSIPPAACPRKVAYSRQQQETAADEMEEIRRRLGRDDIIAVQFMPDCGRLRDQTRACRE